MKIVNCVNNLFKQDLSKQVFFQKLCEEMEAEHTTLLFHYTSWWLSNNNVLVVWVFKLKTRTLLLFKWKGHNNGKNLYWWWFIIKLTYLCKNIYILKLYDKIIAFIKKIDLRKKKMVKPLVYYFKNVFLKTMILNYQWVQWQYCQSIW